MNENIFDKLDFGPFRPLLDNDDITDISYDNGGQIWVRSLTQGAIRVEVEGATPDFVEKLAFQCSNVMGTTFNNAKPFLDVESAELSLNFVHQSIAANGIALVIHKTPMKIRLEEQQLISEDYFTRDIHDLLVKCVQAHCNIVVAGDTGSGRTEFVKYLASHTNTNEKIITIEDTLELHLDKIFPQRNIVSMKTNNVASYSDVLLTCMRQKPDWIILSELRNAESVVALRNAISSGHNVLSTIHSSKSTSIPKRLYTMIDSNLDATQFLTAMHRYIQLGVHIKAYYSKERGKFHREIDEVTEFYNDENNQPKSRLIYKKFYGKTPAMVKPTHHLLERLATKNVDVSEIIDKLPDEMPIKQQDEVVKVEMTNESFSAETNTIVEPPKLEVQEPQEIEQKIDIPQVVAMPQLDVAPIPEPPVVPTVEEPVQTEVSTIDPAAVPVIEQPTMVAPVAPPVAEQPTVVAPVAPPVVEQPTVVAPVAPPVAEQPTVVAPVIEQPTVVAPVAPPVIEQPAVVAPGAPPTVEQPAAVPITIAPDATPAVEIQPTQPIATPATPAIPQPTIPTGQVA